MFFILSKIFWTLVQPLAFLTILMGVGLLFRNREWGRKLILFAGALFIVCGVVPIGPFMIERLEQQTPIPVTLPSRIDGIIVLGGAVNAESSDILGQPQLNEWSERITEMIKLSRTYPQAKVIYTGGAGSLRGQGSYEALIVKKMLSDMGIPLKQYVFEDQARTTFENVSNSKAIAAPRAGENWVLITSAFHMKRSLATFRKQGWNIIPYPAGYIEDGHIRLWQWADVSGNYWKLNIAVKEYIGIIAYELSGRV